MACRRSIWPGSSPRMWGTLPASASPSPPVRFIPTHVGNTSGRTRRRLRGPVHPHACGEHGVALALLGPGFGSSPRMWEHLPAFSRVIDPFGSSPRMWGTQLPAVRARRPARFIPTHVGNTTVRPCRRTGPAVHPHACGEHLRSRHADREKSRFIPTHVGNTQRGRQHLGARTVHPTHVGNTRTGRWQRIRSAVHPHACGEHWKAIHDHAQKNGSSPRMWGTLSESLCAVSLARFIPTHVGNTARLMTTYAQLPVHPHACGEHDTPDFFQPSTRGSSPRMWGTRPLGVAASVGLRFIPTHVGNTRSAPASCRTIPVHPHACGEHARWASTAGRLLGSSPRMWGTHEHQRNGDAPVRFIPTHVGNTSGRISWPPRQTVHPHACGEHGGALLVAALASGSSPRMWGTHCGECGKLGAARFIPTHVGNTVQVPATDTSESVHPHACGEHRRTLMMSGSLSGSSPRMWGTPVCTVWLNDQLRFIPTHVGNTVVSEVPTPATTVHPHACGEHPTAAPVAIAWTVHPHACGEHPTSSATLSWRAGSSPRMWGTPGRYRPTDDHIRFIPTHVGNTAPFRRGS